QRHDRHDAESAARGDAPPLAPQILPGSARFAALNLTVITGRRARRAPASRLGAARPGDLDRQRCALRIGMAGTSPAMTRQWLRLDPKAPTSTRLYASPIPPP